MLVTDVQPHTRNAFACATLGAIFPPPDFPHEYRSRPKRQPNPLILDDFPDRTVGAVRLLRHGGHPRPVHGREDRLRGRQGQPRLGRVHGARLRGAGERIDVDTGCVVAFTGNIDFDVRAVGGIKSMLFGGEGVFLATLTGPGKVWLQSLPFSRLAGRMLASAPQRGGHRDEGSVLGGLGNILGGDRDF